MALSAPYPHSQPSSNGLQFAPAHQENPSVLGTWGLGDSAAAAVWHSWVGTCPLLSVAGSPCNAPISSCLHTEHLGFVPQERDEARSHFLLNHHILWAGSRLCQFMTGNGKEGAPLCQTGLGVLGAAQMAQLGPGCTTLLIHALQSQLLPCSFQDHSHEAHFSSIPYSSTGSLPA